VKPKFKQEHYLSQTDRTCHKNLWPGQGVVDSVKIFLSSRLITMQTLVAVCHTVRVCVIIDLHELPCRISLL